MKHKVLYFYEYDNINGLKLQNTTIHVVLNKEKKKTTKLLVLLKLSMCSATTHAKRAISSISGSLQYIVKCKKIEIPFITCGRSVELNQQTTYIYIYI